MMLCLVWSKIVKEMRKCEMYRKHIFIGKFCPETLARDQNRASGVGEMINKGKVCTQIIHLMLV